MGLSVVPQMDLPNDRVTQMGMSLNKRAKYLPGLLLFLPGEFNKVKALAKVDKIGNTLET